MSQVKVKLYNDKAEEVGEEKLSSDILELKLIQN